MFAASSGDLEATKLKCDDDRQCPKEIMFRCSKYRFAELSLESIVAFAYCNKFAA